MGATARATGGIKGITLNKEDAVSIALPIHDANDDLAVFLSNGIGKRVKLSDFPNQKRAGKGLLSTKLPENTYVASAALVNDSDSVLLVGTANSVCISAKDIPILGRSAIGNLMIKGNIKSVSKV